MYLCIDLKTFFASVECIERGLDPFLTNLVVADESRGKGSICLAITPKMKMLGIKNRCRVYEIPLTIKYITAKPRMQKYIEYSANIYAIYLKYVAKEDIHVYSIDEAFLDVTRYLHMYHNSALELANIILDDIFNTYRLTATAGIGTNLYLTKIALDISAKHSVTNIGYLDEEKFKNELWNHKPLSDFWGIGVGIERRLNKMYLFTMKDIANANPQRLYKEFGINAEILIDHANGKESCTIADIKQYKPKSNSISNSQVLFKDYNYYDAKTVLSEMIELMSLRLVKEDLITDTVCLYIGFSKDIINSQKFTEKLPQKTNIYSELEKEFMRIYNLKINRDYPIRRIGIAFLKVEKKENVQLSIFIDNEKEEKERNLELSINNLRNTYGRNVLFRGMSLQENATGIERNKMIGGHNAN